MSFLCRIVGHRVHVRFFWNSRWKMVGHQKRGMCAVAICERCGKELSPPANQPRKSS